MARLVAHLAWHGESGFESPQVHLKVSSHLKGCSRRISRQNDLLFKARSALFRSLYPLVIASNRETFADSVFTHRRSSPHAVVLTNQFENDATGTCPCETLRTFRLCSRFRRSASAWLPSEHSLRMELEGPRPGGFEARQAPALPELSHIGEGAERVVPAEISVGPRRSGA